jgi:glycosyltransferase involved in cell wall biosynthesis
MKIAYIDLNYHDHFEDYSYHPKTYGGGRIVAGAMMDKLDNFYIYSDEKSFKNLKDGKKSQAKIIDFNKRQALCNGACVKSIIPEADEYDLFFSHTTHINLNLSNCRSQKYGVWSIGFQETIHPDIQHVVFFAKNFQNPILLGRPNIYHAVIGPNIENFKEYKKEDLIFQCTRHTELFQSTIVANFALKNNIQTIFAGPIQKGYPLMDFIDNKTTHYIGEISNEEKIKYNKLAKFHTQFQTYPTCATLSAKESLSYGTPIMATNIGEWPSFIQEGINGFIISNEEDFIRAWGKRDLIDQKKCYDSIVQFSESNMIDQFNTVFKKIINI